jgi:hypothetical protein
LPEFTDITVPFPVPAPIDVLNVLPSIQLTVLFAFALRYVTADGFVDVNTFDPTVVLTKEVPQAEPVETGTPVPGYTIPEPPDG